MPRAHECEIVKYRDGALSRERDPVVEERRADIRVNGRPYGSVLATPALLDYLAIGYLFTEGAIEALADIRSLAVEGLSVHVELRADPPPPPPRARSSGFGLGSVALRDIQDHRARPARAAPPAIKAEEIVALMEEFNQLSALFQKTGAVHSAWLVTGGRRYFAEDVGRHNALDKVIGQYLSDGAPAGPVGLMFTTGRVSSEMLLKAARAGMDALISRGAASGLAVDLAEKLGLVLIGFARGDRFTAFWGGQRLAAPGDSGAAHG